MIRFDVKFNLSNQQFAVNMSDQRFEAEVRFDSDDHFDAKFDAYQEVTLYKDADPYLGDYEVTPAVGAQVLPTAKKLMADDVTVKAIPYYETSNLSDGETVYIGTEVEIYGD